MLGVGALGTLLALQSLASNVKELIADDWGAR